MTRHRCRPVLALLAAAGLAGCISTDSATSLPNATDEPTTEEVTTADAGETWEALDLSWSWLEPEQQDALCATWEDDPEAHVDGLLDASDLDRGTVELWYTATCPTVE